MGADWTLHPWHHNVGGVTASQARHNSSNVGGFTVGQMRHNSSNINYYYYQPGSNIIILYFKLNKHTVGCHRFDGSLVIN